VPLVTLFEMRHVGRVILVLMVWVPLLAETARTAASYDSYRLLLGAAVKGSAVDYAQLTRNRSALDAAVTSFNTPDTFSEPSWTRAERFAFWINAYNAFTIAAIVNHYPIHGRWFSLAPRNSIRQIDGVWTKLKWKVAGREVTLDEIEHGILRPTFTDPRVHFAINCASRSCPPIRPEPYLPDHLDGQLGDAARRYLASPFGLQVTEDRLKVSSIFKWYGEDFVARFAATIDQPRADRDRAILGVIAAYGPPEAAALARSGRARIEFLSYDWSLNDRDR
jgi:hypothetical protein